MLNRAKDLTRRFKRELRVYQLVLIDSRTPRLAKILLGAAIAYLLSPIDLIPDAIPILGQLDDLLIVPGLVFVALRFVPPEVVEDCRKRVEES